MSSADNIDIVTRLRIRLCFPFTNHCLPLPLSVSVKRRLGKIFRHRPLISRK